ncbi:sensor histidine kinase [Nonomuraea endophytica]|uniref:sensor histidine kinase n=1 Tax=Nonomuraea endophytica TaxID=714136 RepID=UPI0037CA8626
MKESDGARAPGQEYRWALPSVLLGDGEEGRPVKRSTRDWIVDTLMFVLACGLTLLTLPEISQVPEPLQATEQVIGALACASLWLRRRWPVTLALALTVLSTGLVLVGGASAVAMFTVAVHRRFRISGPVALANIVTLFPFAYFRPTPDLGFWGTFVLGASIVTALFAWGLMVRARRQLVWSLRVQADTAAEQAKHLERERIAREMHDVLAHRLSILSLHAGALEFRPDAKPAEIARAAGAIRESAHHALQDLRGVIGVLRHSAGDDDVPDRPQPTLADVSTLVAEGRQAGMDVALILPDQEGVPDALGRNAYRIVQEALTNARKHAAGAPVTVRVSGGPGEGLTVEVRNPVGVRLGPRIPGAGAGLIGLTERAELSGGRLEHGPRPDGDFLVKAWLPWTT